jgi:hypothetical protein
VVFGVSCLHRNSTPKWGLPSKVHGALWEKIMKPGTNQDTRWTWLQMIQEPKREVMKHWGPKQKIQEFPHAVRKKTQEDARSFEKQDGENGPEWAGMIGPGWPAQPIRGPVRRPLWPSTPSCYLQSSCEEPRIIPFIIRRRVVEWRETPSRRGEGRDSWLMFP